MQMPMGQMMQNMPEQCRGMMQNMQSCMGMMHQMMQGRMGQGGTMPSQMGPGGMQTTPAQPTAVSASTKAYLDAAEKMHAPMMQGMQAQDPDAAFVRGMIPHHQGAIDMARVVLQYGKDPQVKKWANDVIREQQREMVDRRSAREVTALQFQQELFQVPASEVGISVDNHQRGLS